MLVPLVKLEGGGSEVTLQTGSAEIALQLWNTVRVRYRAKVCGGRRFLPWRCRFPEGQ